MLQFSDKNENKTKNLLINKKEQVFVEFSSKIISILLCSVILHRFAGTNQVTVAISIVDSAYSRPELVIPDPV